MKKILLAAAAALMLFAGFSSVQAQQLSPYQQQQQAQLREQQAQYNFQLREQRQGALFGLGARVVGGLFGGQGYGQGYHPHPYRRGRAVGMHCPRVGEQIVRLNDGRPVCVFPQGRVVRVLPAPYPGGTNLIVTVQ